MSISLDLEADKIEVPPSDSELRQAIENGEFDLNIQLVYDMQKASFFGGEVLSRWKHPSKGILLPREFIPALHQCGRIRDLDLYMLGKTCRILELLESSESSDLCLSCNLSRTTISEKDFCEQFRRILDNYHFEREKLIIEITEDSITFDLETARQNILNCKACGVCIALDDFGVGYTAFSDLCNFPIDCIKIDRSIITKAVSEQGESVLSETVQLAHNLNMQVLCEGVETEQELAAVKRCGCDYIQGFYYCHALPVEQAVEFYLQNRADKS